ICCASAALPPFPKRSSFPPRSNLSARAAQIAASGSTHSCRNACFTRRLSLISSSIQAISSRELHPCSVGIPLDSPSLLLFTLAFKYCMIHLNPASIPLAIPPGITLTPLNSDSSSRPALQPLWNQYLPPFFSPCHRFKSFLFKFLQTLLRLQKT